MMMNDLLRMLLAAADDIDRSFDHAATAIWPPEALDALQRLGILRRSARGLYATCPNCNEGHLEPVTVLAGRFYISCPESLLVEVQPEMCECWEIDPDGLARVVATSMGLVGRPQMVVAERFWRLGRTSWPPGSPKTRPIVFARRMGDDDAAIIAAHVGSGGRAIVVVPHLRPDERIWQGKVPAVIPLTEVMSWNNGQPVLDVMALVDAVETADHLVELSGAISLGATGKKMVRQQVKAEMKGQLEDDVLIAAYKTYGSVRKTADALTEQLGRPITKDKVQGAVTRAGGAMALRQEMDSASVARTVASQRRDRGKKISQYRN